MDEIVNQTALYPLESEDAVLEIANDSLIISYNDVSDISREESFYHNYVQMCSKIDVMGNVELLRGIIDNSISTLSFKLKKGKRNGVMKFYGLENNRMVVIRKKKFQLPHIEGTHGFLDSDFVAVDASRIAYSFFINGDATKTFIFNIDTGDLHEVGSYRMINTPYRFIAALILRGNGCALVDFEDGDPILRPFPEGIGFSSAQHICGAANARVFAVIQYGLEIYDFKFNRVQDESDTFYNYNRRNKMNYYSFLVENLSINSFSIRFMSFENAVSVRLDNNQLQFSRTPSGLNSIIWPHCTPFELTEDSVFVEDINNDDEFLACKNDVWGMYVYKAGDGILTKIQNLKDFIVEDGLIHYIGDMMRITLDVETKKIFVISISEDHCFHSYDSETMTVIAKDTGYESPTYKAFKIQKYDSEQDGFLQYVIPEEEDGFVTCEVDKAGNVIKRNCSDNVAVLNDEFICQTEASSIFFIDTNVVCVHLKDYQIFERTAPNTFVKIMTLPNINDIGFYKGFRTHFDPNTFVLISSIGDVVFNIQTKEHTFVTGIGIQQFITPTLLIGEQGIYDVSEGYGLEQYKLISKFLDVPNVRLHFKGLGMCWKIDRETETVKYVTYDSENENLVFYDMLTGSSTTVSIQELFVSAEYFKVYV
ncbi:hypothetical protein PCE1_000739 [Barthelona sp. PCE]